MKKIISILLVLVMALSAVITVAAETGATEPATPDAPTLLGYQVGPYTEDGEEVEGFVNIRFVSYITETSLSANMLGYNIKAHFTQKDENGNATGGTKEFKATDDPETTTEYNTVFKYIVENKEVNGEPVQVVSTVAQMLNNPTVEGYFFFYSVKKIPADADIYFDVQSYAKVGEEIVSESDSQILNYDADNTEKGVIVGKTYDFSETAVTPADFGAKGKFTNADQLSIVDGKLVVAPALSWSGSAPKAFINLADTETLEAALRNGNGYHQTYVVSMDIEVPYGWKPTTFTLLLNGANSATTSNTVGVRLQPVNPSTQADGIIRTGNNMGVNILHYPLSGNATTSWGNSLTITEAHKTAGTIKFNLAVAYTFLNDTDGARIDTYVDGTWKNKAVVNGSAASKLKFDDDENFLSDITLIAQNVGSYYDEERGEVVSADDCVKIDNFTVSVPVNTESSVVNTSTNKLNALKDTYKATYDVPGKHGITPVASTINKTPAAISIDNGSLKMVAGDNWGSHLVTLAPADMINADNGKIVVDMKLNMQNGKRLSVFLVNQISSNAALASYEAITNTGAVGYRLVSQNNNYLKAWTVAFSDAAAQISGEQITGENKAIQGTSYEFDIRIIADGSTYSLYINGNHALTKSYAGDNDKAINADTSIVLWTQNTEFAISDLTISTFQKTN